MILNIFVTLLLNRESNSDWVEVASWQNAKKPNRNIIGENKDFIKIFKLPQHP